ncbi:MAG: EAL domain-containing protein [Candidatus Competibacteraceae bacterium]
MKGTITLDVLNKFANDIILLTDADDRIIDANDRAVAAYGGSREALLQRRLPELLDPAARAAFARQWRQTGTSEGAIFVTVCRRSDNTTFPAEVSVRSIEVDGRALRHSSFRDISQRRILQTPETDHWEFYANVLDHFPDPVWQADTNGRGRYFNRSWLEFTGRTLEQELGDGWIAGIHPDDREHWLHTLQEACRERRPLAREYRLQYHGEEYRWVFERGKPCLSPDGTLLGYVGSCHDVQEEKQLQEQLRYIGQYDPLTGLPNQTLLEDRLRQALANARRSGKQVVLLFTNLDCFKIVNDSLGYKVGDQLLQQVAKRLKRCLREGDTLSRRGGDEFMVLLSDLRHIEDAAHVADKLLKSLADPYTIDEIELHISASIGISIYPDDGQDVETLLRNADTAMYFAKQNGRNRYQFFTPVMNSRAYEYLMMQNHLRRALEREEFELNYQPQVDLKRGMIVGAEALLRWRHPELGMIAPSQFIPIAEESGLIVPIGEWVMHEACRQGRLWQEARLPPLTIAINLSAAQFRKGDIVHNIERAFRENRLDPSRLELELTEGTVMQNAEEAIRILRELKAMGIKLSIDDFGTGYSSLSYLKRFPIDRLKVDKSFVRDITLNEDDAEITRAIIGMAHGLGLKVIAEGVEHEDQLKFLRWQKCDDMQGYYFSRPLQAGAFEELLASGKTLKN